VEVTALLHPDRLEVQVEGPGEFQLPAALEERPHRGLGLPLMATLADHLALYSGPRGGTLVSLTFYRPGAAARSSPLPPSLLESLAENALFRSVLENMVEGFMLFDRDWRYVYLNQAVAEQTNRPKDELLGRVVWELFPEAIGGIFHREWHRAMREQVPVFFEAYFESTGRWYESRCFPFADGLAVFTRDITARKRAERALAESQRMYAVILERSPAAMALACLPEGAITAVNERFLELFECTRSPRSGRKLLVSLNLDRIDIEGQEFALATVLAIGRRQRLGRWTQFARWMGR
jgi:PAS domain S-box-containing protein